MIKTEAGTDLVLGMSSSTAITLDGNASSLLILGVNIGAKVSASFTSSTNVASSIAATSCVLCPLF
jgi:hypothetical protein